MKSRKFLSAIICTQFVLFSQLPCFSEAISLDRAYQEVLQNAFEMKAAEAEICAREAQSWQAGRYINPLLTASADNIDGDNRCYTDNNQLFVGVTQVFEIGGKRRARVRVAEAEELIANWNFEVEKCQLFVDLMHRFVGVAASQERVHLASKLFEIACQTRESTEIKVTNGKATPLHSKRATVSCQAAKLQLAKREAELSHEIKGLKGMWDGATPCFTTVEFNIHEISAPPPYNQLVDMLSSNPQVLRTHAEMVRACEVVGLERSRRLPDVALQLGVGTTNCTRDPGVYIEIDVPIPIFDRNNGNISRAHHDYNQALFNRMGMEAHLQAELNVLYDEWVTAYEQSKELKESILPHAQEAYEMAENTFKEGKFDYLELLDARTTYFNVQQDYLEAVEVYHHKRADVLKLTAQCCSNPEFTCQ